MEFSPLAPIKTEMVAMNLIAHSANGAPNCHWPPLASFSGDMSLASVVIDIDANHDHYFLH